MTNIKNSTATIKLDILSLCNMIDLQPEVKKRVLAFSNEFDFNIVDRQLKRFQNYDEMSEALDNIQRILGEDEDGIKILACMLKASADIYSLYIEKNISDEIYLDTMACYTRFIDETFKATGKMVFNRHWWTTRQAGGHLFRIGELEYNVNFINHKPIIGIHVPSDADFSPNLIDISIKKSKLFFKQHFPELGKLNYYCNSWLMDSQLKKMLPSDSNIINFQERFDIVNKGKSSTDFLGWVYFTDTTNYSELPENTTLQRNIKKHILSGGVIRNAEGKLKDNTNI